MKPIEINVAFADLVPQELSERLRQRTRFEMPAASGDFTSPVDTLIAGPPVSVPADTSVAEAARIMHDADVSSVLVEGDPPGIVTVRDLRSRVLARGRSAVAPVAEVMSAPLKTRPADTPIYEALFFMLEEKIHHLPLEREARIVGVVTDTDLLRHQIQSPLYLLERVQKVETPEELAYEAEMAGIVETLWHGGLTIEQIGRIVAHLNDALIERLLELAEDDLGAPPTPYAWIVFGSEGRQEQLLLTDQDNALVYADETGEAREYFGALSERVVDGLIQAGFPPCNGGYMATNWHRSLAEWRRLFRQWIEVPDAEALLEAGIFFDYRRAHGDLDLASLEEVRLQAARHRVFLAHMARAALKFPPPLGFFRRIRGEEGKVNVKRGGIIPIVAIARVYALEAGVRARSTFDRLTAAAGTGTLSHAGAENLSEGFRFLQQLRLREQIASLHAGEAAENTVTLDTLSSLERQYLKEVFLVIRDVQGALEMRFQTGMLG